MHLALSVALVTGYPQHVHKKELISTIKLSRLEAKMQKINMMVCPHDTSRNPERWFFFSQYLSARLEPGVLFQVSLDFKEFHANLKSGQIIYANPRDSLKLAENEGYTALVRPESLFDEVVVIANDKVEAPSLERLAEHEAVSVNSMLPTNLALYALSQRSIQPKAVVNRDSWLSVMNAVVRGDFPYGFVYDDFYRSLTNLGKRTVQAFFISAERMASHILMVSPSLHDRIGSLRELLLGMHEDTKGAEVLLGLGFPRWSRVDESALHSVRKLNQIAIPTRDSDAMPATTPAHHGTGCHCAHTTRQ